MASARRVFRGWRVVAASFAINAIHDGFYYMGFSIFFLPISRDLSLSRAATSLPFTLNKIIPAIVGPFLGVWIDRFGAERVLFAGAVLGGAGFAMLRWTHSYTFLLVVLIGFISLGLMGLTSCTSTAVTQWFTRRRSLAMATSNVGYSAGSTVLPPLLAVGVTALGWRTTAMLAGVAIWAVVLPLARQIRGTPEGFGLRPDGDPPTWAAPAGGARALRPAPASRELSVRQALSTPTFWVLAVNMGLQGMVTSTMALHLVAMMTWKGLDETTAGFLVGVLALSGVPWLALTGWLGDRWSKQKMAAVANVFRGVAFLALVATDSLAVWEMVVVLAMLATIDSVYSLFFAMVADLFGRHRYATVRGMLGTATSVMSMGAPVLVGWVYDTTDSYTWFVGPAGIVMFASAAIFWFLPQGKASAPEAGPAGVSQVSGD